MKAPASAAPHHLSAAAAHRLMNSNTAVAARPPHGAEAEQEASTGAAVAPPSEAGSEPDQSANTGEEPSNPAPPPKPAPRRLAAISPPPPRTSAGPYSVQIDAVMDLAGAQKMAQKIRAKGFEPYLVRTQVQGKTWYRLRVGHYATPEEAEAAETKLHQEFNDTSAGN
jgi:septal ring-binding cell division protein DamX